MAEKKVEILVTLKDFASKTLNKIKAAFASMLSPMKNVRRILSLLSSAFIRLKNAVFGLPGLLGGLTVGLIAKSFVDAASTAEQFRTRLTVLLGSVEEGNKLFNEMADLAARVPKTYEEIMASATALAGVMKGGVKQIKEWMPLIVDLSAATGMTLEETTGQIIRMYSAGAASADMFRERGILAMLGFQAGVSYSAEETRKKLMDAWTDPFSQFHGASVLLANTWEGMLSMLGDAWFQFRNMVMDAGLFDFLKAGVRSVLDEIERLKKSGKLEEWARSISLAIRQAILDVIPILGKLYDQVRAFLGYVLEAMVRLKRGIEWAIEKIPGVTLGPNMVAIDEMNKYQKGIEELRKRIQNLQETISDPTIKRESVEYKKASEEISRYSSYIKSLESSIAIWRKDIEDFTDAEIQAALATREFEEGLIAKARAWQSTRGGEEASLSLVETLIRAEVGLQDAIEKTIEDSKKAARIRYYTRQDEQAASAVESAKAQLTQQKALGAARLAVLDHWLDQEIISFDYYYSERLRVIEDGYATERAALVAELDKLGTESLGKRAQVQAKINALEEQRLKEQIKLEKDYAKDRQKVVDQQYKDQLISSAQWQAASAQIAEDAKVAELQILDRLNQTHLKRMDDAENLYAKKKSDRMEWYQERLVRAAAEGDAQMLERLRVQYIEEERLDSEHLETIKQQTIKGLSESGELEISIRQWIARRIGEINREAAEKAERETRESIKRQVEIAREALQVAEDIGNIESIFKARSQLIDLEYIERRQKLEKFLVDVAGMLRRGEHVRTEILEKETAARRALEDMDHAKTVAQIQEKLDAYSRWLQSGAFEARRLQLGGDVIFGKEYELQTEKLEAQYELQKNLANAYYTYIVEHARLAAMEIQKAFETIGSPLRTFMDDLGSIFEYFYEQTAQKSKSWANAMKAIQVGVAIVDALSAGIKAYVAALEIPIVGVYLAPVMMATAITATMAKVAMMKSQSFAMGGLVDKYEKPYKYKKKEKELKVGGVVQGSSPTPTADNIPARLTAGEFVQPVEVVRYYGVGVMEALRKKAVPRDLFSGFRGMAPQLGRERFAAGGLAGEVQKVSSRQSTLEERVEVTNVNLIDPNLYEQFMATPRGKKTQVNMLTANADLIRRIARR